MISFSPLAMPLYTLQICFWDTTTFAVVKFICPKLIWVIVWVFVFNYIRQVVIVMISFRFVLESKANINWQFVFTLTLQQVWLTFYVHDSKHERFSPADWFVLGAILYNCLSLIEWIYIYRAKLTTYVFIVSFDLSSTSWIKVTVLFWGTSFFSWFTVLVCGRSPRLIAVTLWFVWLWVDSCDVLVLVFTSSV